MILLGSRKGTRKGVRKPAHPNPLLVTTSPAAHRKALEAHHAVLVAHVQQERDILQAVSQLHSLPPDERSVPKVLKALGLEHLCRQTVWRRLTGQSRPGPITQEKGRKVSLAVEEVLAEWIKWMGRQGMGFNRMAIRLCAQQLAGLAVMPGKRWMQLFEQRHPDIDFSNPRPLDPKRSQAFNPTTVKAHFNDLAEAKEGVQLCMTVNIDEMGLQRGGGRKCLGRQVAFAANDKTRCQRRSDNLELTTVIDGVCADGSALVPGFVFSGKNVYEDSWFDQEWAFVALTESGWTNDEVAVWWLRHSLGPQMRAKEPDMNEPILLIYDGHGSHLTDNFLEEAMLWNMRVYRLPAHTTHKLQPLDVGCFGPVKNAWTERCTEITARSNRDMPRCDVVNEYLAVREKALTESIVQWAWAEVGFSPWNPSKFTDADFAPSQVTSCVVHLPLSFTAEISSAFTRTIYLGRESLDTEQLAQPEELEMPAPSAPSRPASPTPFPSDLVLYDDVPRSPSLLPSPAEPITRADQHTASPVAFTTLTLKPPRIPFNMPALEQARLWQEYAEQMTSIASQETRARETAVAQRDLVARELQDILTREEAERQAKSRPRKVARKYEGGYLTKDSNTAIRKKAQEDEAEVARQERDATARKADERRAVEEEWALMRNDSTVEFRGKLTGSKFTKPVLQSVCFLLDLDTSPALLRADYITSIKTKISASSDLQQDPRFADLDWDDTGRGRGRRRKRCKTGKDTEVAEEEDDSDGGDNDDDAARPVQLVASASPSASPPSPTPTRISSPGPPSTDPSPPCPLPRPRPKRSVRPASPPNIGEPGSS